LSNNGDPAGSERINSFALVAYLPQPLGHFVDALRRDLVPGCFAQSHVTILTPRRLEISFAEASASLAGCLQHTEPIELELGGVEVFGKTAVVYLDIIRGRERLLDMHAALNRNGLAFDEPFPYHPHVTLAQEFDPADVGAVRAEAERRWRASSLPRVFRAESFMFVQNTANNHWIDLAEFRLGGPVPAVIEK
jgi:2'-5' RNA ligase